MLDLPRIGTPVWVEDVEGVSYRSRLEEVVGDTLRLAAPLETVGPATPHPGHRYDVYWAQTRARVILPCRLLGVADVAPHRWILSSIGSPRSSNRREFVRGNGAGRPVRLGVGRSDDVMEGRLLDISEGGLRCWVATTPPVGSSGWLRVTVELDGTELELPASVVAVRDAYDEPGKHVILSFQIGERVAQQIRRHVFTWEIAERRQLAA